MINKNKIKNGFSLIEVMVTLAVLGVGLLGLIGLQLSSIKSSKESLLTTQAALYLSDMSERIRANPDVPASYIVEHAVKPAAIDCKLNACIPTELAQFDVFKWQTLLADNLPQGGGQIAQVGSSLVITVRWDPEKKGLTGTNCPQQSNEDLACIQVEVEI